MKIQLILPPISAHTTPRWVLVISGNGIMTTDLFNNMKILHQDRSWYQFLFPASGTIPERYLFPANYFLLPGWYEISEPFGSLLYPAGSTDSGGKQVSDRVFGKWFSAEGRDL